MCSHYHSVDTNQSPTDKHIQTQIELEKVPLGDFDDNNFGNDNLLSDLVHRWFPVNIFAVVLVLDFDYNCWPQRRIFSCTPWQLIYALGTNSKAA
jgi:hypothetical protein